METRLYDVIGFKYLKARRQMKAELVVSRVGLDTARRFKLANKTRYPEGVDILRHPYGLSLVHK